MALLRNRIRRRASPPGPVPEIVAECGALQVRLGQVPVLNGVDLEVRRGEVLSLVGPNGAGKSTLLAAIAGDLRATAGTVRLWGRDPGEWAPIEAARRRAALPQSHLVSFPFKVAEVVAMGRAPWAGTRASDDDERHVRTALSACEIDQFAPRTFNELSGGERARVMLARVLAQDTSLVLLDEPTAALDLRHQELVGRLCRRLAAAGRAVVVVLHDLNLAAAYSDRVALLDGGVLVECGDPAAVLTAERIGEVYRQPVAVRLDADTGTPQVSPIR